MFFGEAGVSVQNHFCFSTGVADHRCFITCVNVMGFPSLPELACCGRLTRTHTCPPRSGSGRTVSGAVGASANCSSWSTSSWRISARWPSCSRRQGAVPCPSRPPALIDILIQATNVSPARATSPR
ncbi:hypothetical protein Sked_19770 [Sanguibacter keddieii DSM 10542]|uniref:Uncharacterized protein n=1 Tax=Sanguibacter keddieii (strain ATCC 51767 / DSM 10542 / NCFB 3025 / ST-74) TaxID=446469 RepID=D1BHI2_SANKS|nr:hypothetical protein Sked_19770 [Sanguibacter keddieii DSM 10542]